SAKLIASINDKATAARLKKEAESRAAELRHSAAVRIRKQAAASPAGDATARPIATGSASQSRPSTYEGDDAIEASTRSTADLSQAGAEIRERDRVRITSLAREGTVETISGDEYTVLVGALRFRARRDEIELLSRGAKPASSRAAALPRGVSAD